MDSILEQTEYLQLCINNISVVNLMKVLKMLNIMVS